MTADVIAIVSLVLRKLSDLIAEEARFLSGVADDMKWIQRIFMTLQASLKDADDAKHKKNEGARNWVKQVRELAYDAEDIIDYFIGEVAIREADRQGLLGPVRSIVSYPNELLTDHAIGVQIQTIKSRISDLSSDWQTLGINAINEGGGGQEPSSSWDLHQCRRRRAHQDELDIFGLQDAMESLKDRLLDGDPNRCVVSIVGMGGSGKTTLARKVYHEVKDKFNCHAFIYVSQHYACKEILTRLIKSVMVPKPEAEEIEKLSNQELEDKLRYYLSGNRYLVVIDDIWSKDAWDEFLFVLPQGSKKSRVMLTTRNKVVAARADPSPHETRLLNDDEGWKLFLRKAFPWENAPFVCPELEKIGRDIFAKCHGLPLAIVLLGGLLSTKDKQLHQWSRVLDNVTKRLAESSNELMELMEILALSYSDLPYYLKHCFLYFGLFRPSRKHEISSKKLIRLWIAEGLCEEDRADDYLEELINRSMIQVVTRRIDGSIRTCRIHDLLSDLSISEAKENNFFAIQADNGTIEGLSSVRRLTLSCVTKMNEAINCPATLRSMLCFSNDAMDLSKLLRSSRGVKFLRVLEILRSQKLPKNIGNFVNLRYLSLRGEAIKRLPSSICGLSQLLALELTFMGTLPCEIYDLGQLRHLCTYYYVIDGRPRLNRLKNLQTVCLSAGNWIQENCLGKLSHLRKLGITGVLENHHEALFVSIDKLHSLRSLKLVCGKSRRRSSIPQNMPFAHGSHPHLYKMYLDGLMKKLIELPQNLAKLTLLESELKQDAIDTLEKLRKLETLRLLAGSYCSETMHCSSGGFPQLKFLKLDCSHLKKWTAEEGSMPSLRSVELPNRDDLRTLPDRVRDLLR